MSHLPDARLLNPLVIAAFSATAVVSLISIAIPFPDNADAATMMERLVHNPFVIAIEFVGIWAIFYGSIQLWASSSNGSPSRMAGLLSGQGNSRQYVPIVADANLSAGLFGERWHVLSAQRLAPLSYAVWVLPLMGFIGTVVGISEAIGGLGTVFGDGDRQEALRTVLGALRYAFDTTFAGLVLVIPVMALSNWLSLADDRARDIALSQLCSDGTAEK